jgi:hypothetical protein
MATNLVRWSGLVAMLGCVLGIFLTPSSPTFGPQSRTCTGISAGRSIRSKVDPGLGNGTRRGVLTREV